MSSMEEWIRTVKGWLVKCLTWAAWRFFFFNLHFFLPTKINRHGKKCEKYTKLHKTKTTTTKTPPIIPLPKDTN